jgi:hypothetical protein
MNTARLSQNRLDERSLQFAEAFLDLSRPATAQAEKPTRYSATIHQAKGLGSPTDGRQEISANKHSMIENGSQSDAETSFQFFNKKQLNSGLFQPTFLTLSCRSSSMFFRKFNDG